MIDNRAVIDPSAELASDVYVGPYAVIGQGVQIGAGSWIGPHAVIGSHTKLGEKNKVFPFAAVGSDPQDLKYEGGTTLLVTGNGNTFREFCSINRGTEQGGGITRIGNDNLFMSYSHVAHDCTVHNHVIFSNSASLAGHVVVEDYVGLGGFVGVFQYCTLGAYSFICGSTNVVKDVLPFMMVSGFHASPYGLNLVGLKRRGFSPEAIKHLRQAYRIIYRQGLTTKEAFATIEPMAAGCAEIQQLLEAMGRAKNGFVR